MHVDDRVYLIGAANRLVDALAEQGDRPRIGGKEVEERLKIGHRHIAGAGDRPDILVVECIPKAFGYGNALRQIIRVDQQIGRASCRERVCQYVKISVVAVSLTQKNNNKTKHTRTTKTLIST